jgi:hypothetical protein
MGFVSAKTPRITYVRKNVTNKNVTRWVDNQIYNRPLHFDLQNEPPQENARDSRPEPSRYDCYSHFSPGRLPRMQVDTNRIRVPAVDRCRMYVMRRFRRILISAAAVENTPSCI